MWKTFSFQKPNSIEHYSIEVNALPAWDSLLLAKVLTITPLLWILKIDGMCIWQSLPDTILRILLSRYLVSLTNRLTFNEL